MPQFQQSMLVEVWQSVITPQPDHYDGMDYEEFTRALKSEHERLPMECGTLDRSE